MHTNRLIILPFRPIAVLFYLALILILPQNLQAQNLKPVAEWLETYRASADFRPVALFQRSTDRSDLSNALEEASVLSIKLQEQNNLLQTAPPALLFALPAADGSELELELAQVEILAPDFFVSTNVQDRVDYHPGLHYRGIVRGNPNSVAAISVTDSGVMGMIANESGTYELGQMEDGSGRYVFYKTEHLKAQSPNNCFTDDTAVSAGGQSEPAAGDRGIGCKTVQVYFECDYRLFTDKGSNTTNVSNYVTSLFNQVATLYANENIGIAISQIYVWTSTDPYTGYNSTSSVLNAFQQTRGTNFNGNLAHLLSTRSLGGGIAYVDVICSKSYAFGVSAISTTFQNVPTYSWSVEVVTHELGHNLGSWHTHSCNWPTGALDNCVSPEGSCSPGPAPTNGGTIMSYCHLTSYGINFNNGFGPAPGARIRDKVSNASCLQQSGVAPTGLSSSNVTSSSATLSWTPVAGATSYTIQYKLSSAGTWTTAGTTAAVTYNLSGLSAAQTYQWQVKTDCSNYSATASFTTTSSGGGGGGGSICNAPGGLSAYSITANSASLSWSLVSGASNYSVQYKTNSASSWTSAGTTNSNTVNLSNLSASTTYNWQVKANCSGWSSTSNFSTSSGGGGGTCEPPANLYNNTVSSTYASISWSAVNNASSYTLQIKLASGANWFTLGSVTVTSVILSGLSPSTSYQWRVKASCSDYSASKTLTTTANIDGDGTGYFGQPTIQEVSETPALELFPNPASEQLNLRLSGTVLTDYRIILTDATGKLVASESYEPTIDVSALAPGIYFVHLLDSERRVDTKKFIKIK